MARFLIRRVALALATLFAASVLIFAATQVLPGDAARAILGQQATPVRLEALREQLHLNQPAVVQYWHWLTGILTGNLGQSLANGRPVRGFLADRITNTAFLLLVAALMSIPISVLLGMASAVRRDKVLDHTVGVLALVLASLPEFVTAIGLTVLLGTTVFRVLPPTSIVPPGEPPWHHVRFVLLPAMTLALAVLPYVVRIMRGSMVEVLESDYIEFASLKGLRRRELIFRHALPNAVGPTAQAVALSLAYLAGGAVVVEYVFAYPGIGQGLVNAVVDRDVPVVQFLTLILAGFYVFVNLVADVVTILLTPTVRTSL